MDHTETSNIKFDYHRADSFDEPQEPHLLSGFESYGQLRDITSDANWKKHRLYRVYDRTAPLLSALSSKCQTIEDLQLDDFIPEAQEDLKAGHIREPYESLLNIIREERQASQQNISNLQIRILNVSNPSKPKELPDRLDYNSKMLETREILRSKATTQDRLDTIKAHLDKGSPNFLHACILSPDEIIPTKRLSQLRRDYAFQKHPTMRDAEQDAIELSAAVEQRTGEIAGTAVAVLRSHDLEMPISKKEFFEYFPAKDENEKHQKDRMIKHEQALNDREQKRRDFDNATQGINL